MIYKIRVVLDVEDDVFRDIEVDEHSTLEDLHNVIHQSFQLSGDEMASFYASDDDWNQGKEFCLFDMSGGLDPVAKMSDHHLAELLHKQSPNAIYIYDFLTMWTFMINLIDVEEKEEGVSYPQVLYAIGVLPDAPPERSYEADPRYASLEDEDDLDDDEDLLDMDDYNEYY